MQRLTGNCLGAKELFESLDVRNASPYVEPAAEVAVVRHYEVHSRRIEHRQAANG